MTWIEDLQPNASVRGILPGALAIVVSVEWFALETVEVTFKDPAGRLGNPLRYRHDETRTEVVELGRPWSFDGDGELFRLVSEAHRIQLAHFYRRFQLPFETLSNDKLEAARNGNWYLQTNLSWPEIVRLAREGGEPGAEQDGLFGETEE